MAELSAQALALARKNSAAILQRLASVGQIEAAKSMSVSESTVSRLKSEQLESFTAFLAVLDLKVVAASNKCYAPDYIKSLKYFARIAMAKDEDVTAPELEWEEDA